MPKGRPTAYTAGRQDRLRRRRGGLSQPARKVRIVTVARMRTRKLMFTAVVDCQPAGTGNVQSLAVRVRIGRGKVHLRTAGAA